MNLQEAVAILNQKQHRACNEWKASVHGFYVGTPGRQDTFSGPEAIAIAKELVREDGVDPIRTMPVPKDCLCGPDNCLGSNRLHPGYQCKKKCDSGNPSVDEFVGGRSLTELQCVSCNHGSELDNLRKTVEGIHRSLNSDQLAIADLRKRLLALEMTRVTHDGLREAGYAEKRDIDLLKGRLFSVEHEYVRIDDLHDLVRGILKEALIVVPEGE
jgi:hypothetical protein